ncbi:MAG: hypothetical protein H7Y11_06345 [Armatimonadetes bacterium]|nr:hypothetical protein [Anaerolineae bacterium]
MRKKLGGWLALGVVWLLLTGCDPMAPQVAVIVVTDAPTLTPTSALSPTPTLTRTPFPTETPDVTATPTPFPCDEAGSIIALTFESATARETLAYDVYIPPCYQVTLKRFPVVYLLHAEDENQTQWVDLGIISALDSGIQLGVLPPMLVVMPAMGAVGLRNRFPPDPAYETVLLNELMPSVETDFCTLNNRQQRAIGGISRGGFWAYSIGLRQPQTFGSVGGHSALLPEDGDDDAAPSAFNPLEIARNSTILPGANLRLYLDNAVNDFTAAAIQTLSNRLTARSIPHSYIINTVGDHNNDYWAAHLGEYLEFYGRDWERNYSALPSCLEPSP